MFDDLTCTPENALIYTLDIEIEAWPTKIHKNCTSKKRKAHEIEGMIDLHSLMGQSREIDMLDYMVAYWNFRNPKLINRNFEERGLNSKNKNKNRSRQESRGRSN